MFHFCVDYCSINKLVNHIKSMVNNVIYGDIVQYQGRAKSMSQLFFCWKFSAKKWLGTTQNYPKVRYSGLFGKTYELYWWKLTGLGRVWLSSPKTVVLSIIYAFVHGVPMCTPKTGSSPIMIMID